MKTPYIKQLSHLRLLLIIALGLFSQTGIQAQPGRTAINVIVSPSRADWTYPIGESVTFEVYVLQNNVKMQNLPLTYEYGPEMMKPDKQGLLDLKNGTATLVVPGLKTAGFQTVKASVVVNGKTYSNYTTVGYEPDKIKPTVELPADFETFWKEAIKETATIPLKPKMTLLPERCTEKTNVYHIVFQNNAVNSYIYGILCVPKKPGTYPAILKVPGAGVRGYNGEIELADKGVITLEIGIHGIPVNLDPSIYSSLHSGALNQYAFFNLDNRDTYYFKRVYLGCVRAVDFLFTLEQFDKDRLAVMGGSQGGGLSIVTASLDKRVKFAAAQFPALCDLTGFLHNRADGWPHLFRKIKDTNLEKKIETASYYDAVNFARSLNVPIFFCWGYNDMTCPPTSMYSAYNVIRSEKELMLMQDTGHWFYPEERERLEQWLLNKLGVK